MLLIIFDDQQMTQTVSVTQRFLLPQRELLCHSYYRSCQTQERRKTFSPIVYCSCSEDGFKKTIWVALGSDILVERRFPASTKLHRETNIGPEKTPHTLKSAQQPYNSGKLIRGKKNLTISFAFGAQLFIQIPKGNQYHLTEVGRVN